MDKGCKGCISHVSVGGNCNSDPFCARDSYHAYRSKLPTKKERLEMLKQQYGVKIYEIRHKKEEAFKIAMRIRKLDPKSFFALESVDST